MRVLISIDDTDNHESQGTGEMALRFAGIISARGWGTASFISRHQLYVHRDIPYTSHNSAMCFEANVLPQHLDEVVAYGGLLLSTQSALGSDPGFCLVSIDSLKAPELLLQFGRRAKTKVLTKKEAYAAARALGVHLSEHGGTGGGVIGALAGSGLRLGGSDGRIKGKYFYKRCGDVLKVRDILAHTDIQEVRAEKGGPLVMDEGVALGEKVKSVLLGGKNVLLVEENHTYAGAKWITLSRDKVRQY